MAKQLFNCLAILSAKTVPTLGVCHLVSDLCH